MAGIYIHIPYCKRKCYYCDFYSQGVRNAPWGEYKSAVLTELKARQAEWGLMCESVSNTSTLYIGGGTPSQMPAAMLADLITGVHDNLPHFKATEVTVELNPEDVSIQLCNELRRAGVNRVSMGVQSFNDTELKAVGRMHTSCVAIKAYEMLRREFENISIDLIFGLPLQTLDSWEKSVRQVMSLCPEHISAYSLMWEERAALYKMQQLGKVHECNEDLSESMFTLLSAMLNDAGYQHYEISNYCQPSYESCHNSAYWTGEPYLGLGPSAHSYDGNRLRRFNPSDTRKYIEYFNNFAEQRTSFYDEEILSNEEMREEYIMTRLRRCQGIDLQDYESRFGTIELNTLLRKASRCSELLAMDDTSIRLTEKSVMRSDTAILALI